jgi:excisionase family DNA binding protein
MTGRGKIESPLLTPAEACAYLRITDNTLYRWIKEGVIPVVKIGRNYRIRASDLEEVTKSNKGASQ